MILLLRDMLLPGIQRSHKSNKTRAYRQVNFVDEIAENVDQEDHDLEFVEKNDSERRKPDFERRKQRFSTLKRGFKTSKNDSERRIKVLTFKKRF